MIHDGIEFTGNELDVILARRRQRALDPGLSAKQIKRLDSVKITKEMADILIEESCSICLEQFAQGMTVRKLTCRHVFHQKCIDTWL